MKLLDEALDFVIVPIKHSDARHDGAVFKVFVLNAAFFVHFSYYLALKVFNSKRSKCANLGFELHFMSANAKLSNPVFEFECFTVKILVAFFQFLIFCFQICDSSNRLS